MSIPLSTIKSALKIDYSDDDTTLILYREAAESLISRETGLSLSPADRTMYLASFTDTAVPFLPFIQLKNIAYTDTAGNPQTLDSAKWWIDLADGPIPIVRFLDQPAIKEGTNITATVNSGYQEIPNELVHCVIALVGGWYNNPEAFQPIGLNAVPMSVDYILASYRARSFLR